MNDYEARIAEINAYLYQIKAMLDDIDNSIPNGVLVSINHKNPVGLGKNSYMFREALQKHYDELAIKLHQMRG